MNAPDTAPPAAPATTTHRAPITEALVPIRIKKIEFNHQGHPKCITIVYGQIRIKVRYQAPGWALDDLRGLDNPALMACEVLLEDVSEFARHCPPLTPLSAEAVRLLPGG